MGDGLRLACGPTLFELEHDDLKVPFAGGSGSIRVVDDGVGGPRGGGYLGEGRAERLGAIF